jgi:Xaa-Pro dipeptidase
MPIGHEEYVSRYRRVEKAMHDEELDLLLVYSQGNRNMYANLLYLTGYYCFDPCLQGALLISRAGDPNLILNFEWDLDRAARTCWIDRAAMSFSRDLPGGIAGRCRELGAGNGRIGLAGEAYMPLAVFREIQRHLPDAQFVPATHIVEKERLVKSPAEVEAMRVAAAITERAAQAGFKALREGVSELEILSVCVRTMLEQGADEPAFTAQVSFGKNTEVCMAPASRNTLRAGDWVMFDMGCLFEHYLGDLSRTRVFGKPSAEQRAIYDLVLRAQDAAIDSIRPGVTAHDVDDVARAIIAKAGYGEHFNHWLGRGEGLDLHERPFIEQGDGMQLRPGMVFSVEPGVYLSGVGGARVEETVLVTETGHEVISDMSHREWPL